MNAHQTKQFHQTFLRRSVGVRLQPNMAKANRPSKAMLLYFYLIEQLFSLRFCPLRPVRRCVTCCPYNRDARHNAWSNHIRMATKQRGNKEPESLAKNVQLPARIGRKCKLTDEPVRRILDVLATGGTHRAD